MSDAAPAIVHLEMSEPMLERLLGLICRRDPLLTEILHKLERLIQMSGTLQEQLAAAQADTNAKLDAVGTDVTDISTDIDTLLASMTPGSTITPELLIGATSIQSRVAALKDALDAVNAKVPPPTV